MASRHQAEPIIDRKLGVRLERWVGLARLVLWWERLWPALWPAAGVAGLFLAFALFDLLPVLPEWLHGLALAGFAAAFGYALWRNYRPATKRPLHRVRRPGLAAPR